MNASDKPDAFFENTKLRYAVTQSSSFAPSTVMKYHYLVIALAGNDIQMNHPDIKRRNELEPLMLDKYSLWCDKISTTFRNLIIPPK
jgi:hypothetical protein